jgi:bifunctional enzyme CysN/CysC
VSTVGCLDLGATTADDVGAVSAARCTRGGATVWLTGLPAAGKSTIARVLSDLLASEDPVVFDGDDLRATCHRDLGFSAVDRAEQVRRVGELALAAAMMGRVSIVALVSPYAADRAEVRRGHEEAGVPFVEAYVATSLETCEARDPKDLYRRARAGELSFFTGVSDPYEPPVAPEVLVVAEGRTPDDAARTILAALAGARTR